MTFNVTAIILKREDFREADIRVVFLSRELGKGEAVAVGAKKIGSKLAGQLEPWREVKLMLAKGRSFDKIGQVVLLNNFSVHRNFNVESVWEAKEAMQFVDRVITWRQSGDSLYFLVKKFLELIFLARISQNLSTIFKWKLIEQIGLYPQVKKCLSCDKILKVEESFFSFDNGGLSCLRCPAGKEKQRQRISSSATAWLKVIKQYPLEDLAGKKMAKEVGRELNNLLEIFLKFHLF